jgi:DNA-binding MarR family transcriptional regulator
MARQSSISALETHLGYWLRYVSNQISQSFSRKVASAGVSVAEWVILRELYDSDALAPSILAAKTGMTRGGISKIADKLAGKSLVTRTQSDKDLRYQALALTAKGRALVPKLATLADDNDEEFFSHLGAAERKTIEKIMRDIVRRHGLTSVPVE